MLTFNSTNSCSLIYIFCADYLSSLNIFGLLEVARFEHMFHLYELFGSPLIYTSCSNTLIYKNYTSITQYIGLKLNAAFNARETFFVSRFLCITKFFFSGFLLYRILRFLHTIQVIRILHCQVRLASRWNATKCLQIMFTSIGGAAALDNRVYTYKSSCSKKLEESEIGVKQIFKYEHS